MTVEQKRVSSWLAILMLVVAVVWLAWLTYWAWSSDFVDNPAGDDPSLHLSWRIALWFVELGTLLKPLFAILITVIMAGVAAAAQMYKSTGQITIIAVLCLAGVGLSIMLMVLIGIDANGEILRYYSKYETLRELGSAANVFLGSMIGWFSGFLASQLGIRVAPEGGTMKRLLARAFG